MTPIADASAEATPSVTEWDLPTKRLFEERLKMLGIQKTLDEIEQELNTQEGKQRIARAIKDADSSVNGNIDGILDQIDLNREQLQKKESFFKRMLKLPGKALNSVWRTIKKHPYLTATLLIALATGGAYYLGYLPKVDWGSLWARLKNLLKFGGGGGAAAGAGEAAAEGAAEAAAEGARATADIVTTGRSILYGGKEYTVETFGEVLKEAYQKNPDLFLKIYRSENSRVLTNIRLRLLLEEQGLTLKDFHWIEELLESPWP